MTKRPHRWVALVVAAGCAGVPATTNAATLSIAPIHEPFTPLPCTGKPSQRTTIQLEGCAERQILKSDKRIDALNRVILRDLGSRAAEKRFVSAHKAWLSYRRAYCRSRADVTPNGTEAPLQAATCTVGLNAQHVKDLTAFANELSAE